MNTHPASLYHHRVPGTAWEIFTFREGKVRSTGIIIEAQHSWQVPERLDNIYRRYSPLGDKLRKYPRSSLLWAPQYSRFADVAYEQEHKYLNYLEREAVKAEDFAFWLRQLPRNWVATQQSEGAKQ